jgi:hypothetical protein
VGSILMSLPAVFTSPSSQSKWLNREQAAAYISRQVGVPMTATILANRASRGDGPPYRIWAGKGSLKGGSGRYAVYRPADLDAWIETQFRDPIAPASANGAGRRG